MRPLDPLLAVRERPALVERAVRSALIDAVQWRLGGGSAPSRAAFGAAAVAVARPGAARANVDAAGRLALAAATERAATRFFASSLGRRLMTVPSAQLVAAPYSKGGADVAVRDAAQRLHLISLTALRLPLDIAARARAVAACAALAPQDGLAPVRIHLYSLWTGKRYVCSRRLTPAGAALRRSA